jgi:hypothetical protein
MFVDANEKLFFVFLGINSSTISKRKIEADLSGGDESEDYDIKRIKAEPEVTLGPGLDESREDFDQVESGNDKNHDVAEFESFTQFGDEEGFDESLEEISRAPPIDSESKGIICCSSSFNVLKGHKVVKTAFRDLFFLPPPPPSFN